MAIGTKGDSGRVWDDWRVWADWRRCRERGGAEAGEEERPAQNFGEGSKRRLGVNRLFSVSITVLEPCTRAMVRPEVEEYEKTPYSRARGRREKSVRMSMRLVSAGDDCEITLLQDVLATVVLARLKRSA